MKTALPILAVAAFCSSCHQEEKDPISVPEKEVAQGKLLLMHYMPWYETPEIRGRWGSHWTGHQRQHQPDKVGANGLPDIWSHYSPLIGLYDSTDPDVLECQLLQMKLAGVNGVIVDWYGLGDAADYPAIHLASTAMFEAVSQFGMSFSVCFEDRIVDYLVKTGKLSEDEIGRYLEETMGWLEQEWFEHPRYTQLNSRPLLLNFGPMFIKDAAVWDQAFDSLDRRPMHFALHHLWKGVGADGGFSWVHFDAWKRTEPNQVKERLGEIYSGISDKSSEVIVSALPGFRDVYQESHPVVEHRDGETLKESLAVCMEGPWEVVQLVTWNDYGEGTMIEPTHEFGYRFLEIIQAARRRELGEGFRYLAADLRLPAKLLRLRKRGDVDEGELSKISKLLAEGACQEARERLRKYD